MVKIISKRKSVLRKRYDLEFGNVHDAERPCYAFVCNQKGEIESFACEEAKKNYHKVMELAKEDDYYKPHIVEYKYHWIENAKAICECGNTIELWDQYQGASRCEYCGRWHNLFGQTLIDPEYWEEE